MSEKLPLLLIEMVLLPGTQAVLRLDDTKAQKMVQKAHKEGMPIGILFCKDADNAEQTAADVGCLADISECTVYEDDGFIARLEGSERFKPVNISKQQNDMYLADYTPLPQDIDMALDDGIFDSILHLLDIYLDYLESIDPELVEEMPDDLSGFDLTFLVLDHMSVSEEVRQQALETGSLKERAQFCLALLRQEIERLKFLIEGAVQVEDLEEDDIIPERLN